MFFFSILFDFVLECVCLYFVYFSAFRYLHDFTTPSKLERNVCLKTKKNEKKSITKFIIFQFPSLRIGQNGIKNLFIFRTFNICCFMSFTFQPKKSLAINSVSISIQFEILCKITHKQIQERIVKASA